MAICIPHNNTSKAIVFSKLARKTYYIVQLSNYTSVLVIAHGIQVIFRYIPTNHTIQPQLFKEPLRKLSSADSSSVSPQLM